MPSYCFACDCGRAREVIRPMRDSDLPETCKCGKQMYRDFHVENQSIGDHEYARPIISNSLAISPSQVAEHRRLFPEVKITDEGQPVFESYRKHDAYLKKIGAYKRPQKVRGRGKRIATTAK